MAGGPGPLEVIAPEPACDIDGFADKVQAGDASGLKTALIQPLCIDPAPHDLCFFIAGRSIWHQRPGLDALRQVFEQAIRRIGQSDRSLLAQPLFGQTLGPKRGQQGPKLLLAPLFGLDQLGRQAETLAQQRCAASRLH